MKGSIQKIIISLLGVLYIFGFSKALALSDEQNNFVNSGQLNVVMSDADFVAIDSMSVDQIQAFFNGYGSYLKDYVDNSDAGRGRSAAQVIYDAAHGKYEASGTLNGITLNESTGTVSPKVLLVYLQKEQSLAQRPDYDEWAMTASMGYFCYAGVLNDHPTLTDDNHNNCADEYEGFTKQVENAAWQLRYAYERAQGTGFTTAQVGQTFSTGDGYSITLTNRATSSIYRYTPYVFNSAFNVWNLFYNRYQFGTSPSPTNPTPPASSGPQPPSKAGDCDRSGGVDSTDLSILADSWGKQVDTYTRGDLNGDGNVDSTDLSILADGWGK